MPTPADRPASFPPNFNVLKPESMEIAVIAAGAMGSAVARRLTNAGCTVLTNLDGRSEATRR